MTKSRDASQESKPVETKLSLPEGMSATEFLALAIAQGLIAGNEVKSFAKTITSPRSGMTESLKGVVKLENAIRDAISLEDLKSVDHASLHVIFVVDFDRADATAPVKVTLSTVSDKSCAATIGTYYAETLPADRGVPSTKSRYASRIQWIHQRGVVDGKHTGFRPGSLVLSQRSPDLRLFKDVDGKPTPYTPSTESE